MFREASIYALKRLSAQDQAAYGLRVLVMRRWPRGVCKSEVDVWLPSAAPEGELLSAYQDGTLSWPEFSFAYMYAQLHQARPCQMRVYRSQEPSQRLQLHHGALDQLLMLAEHHQVVTLLCWEQRAHCHRFLLKELLEAAVPIKRAGESPEKRAVFGRKNNKTDLIDLRSGGPITTDLSPDEQNPHVCVGCDELYCSNCGCCHTAGCRYVRVVCAEAQNKLMYPRQWK